MGNRPKIDLAFSLAGRQIPVDHGYALFGAVSRVLPCAHEDSDVGLALIRGAYSGSGMLSLTPYSVLALRIPADSVPAYLPLAGKTLDVLGNRLQVGIPHARGLAPLPVLYSHLVTTRNCQDRERFQEEMHRQMEALGISGRMNLCERRTFRVHHKNVVGYSMTIAELTAEESVALQENGLGGRRRMGCGMFGPVGKDA